MNKSIDYNRPVPSWALPVTRGVFVLAIAVLTYQSIVPVTGSSVITHFDKIMHALGYAVLTGLLALAAPRMGLLKLFVFPTLYGGAMEIAQSLMPYGRTGSVWDLLANMVGTAFIVLSIWAAWRLWALLKPA